MEAAACSKGYASVLRRGDYLPHVSTWRQLAALVGVEVDPPRAPVLTYQTAADLREQCADDWEHEQAAAMLRAEAGTGVVVETVEPMPTGAAAVAR
jgi:hypothetical protein